MIAVPIHRRTAIGALAAGVLLAATATVPAYAQDELVVLETVRTTTYVNGGIGKDEEAYMRRIVKDWSLRMIFSERKDNEFVADVNLLVTDMRGAPVLVLPAAGPMTYAMLPAGKYRVTASFRGKAESREVTLDGKQARDVYFHWKGQPKIDPWDGRPLGSKQAPG
jgi:hypothetical protein